MKKALTVIGMIMFLISCEGTTKSTQEENVMTEEQETALADSLSAAIEKDQMELEKVTQEKLTEIDSLLENF